MSYPVLIVPEGPVSSDGRSIDAGILTWRDDVELMFTDETTEGHLGAFHVGNVLNIRRQTVEGETWIVGDLVYDIDAEAAEAERLAVEGRIRRVSADIATIWTETDEINEDGFPIMELVSAEIVGVTQTPMSAFGEARILVGEEKTLIPELVVAALPAGIGADWFADPGLEGPTPLTVEGSRVYGHLATWDTCHTGNSAMCVTPPRGTDYRYFHTGEVLVDGEKIAVGQITMGTGHAPLSLNAMEARQAHYDNTGACAADVRVGEDEFGIWVAGALREGIDEASLRAAALSGDWRRVDGNMELLAALAVNVPGFPIPRLTASALNDEPLALVASGIVVEVEPDPLEALTARVEALEMLKDVLIYEEGTEIVSVETSSEWGYLAAVLD